MKAQYLRLQELVVFGEGTINLSGRRLVLHSIDALPSSERTWLNWSVQSRPGAFSRVSDISGACRQRGGDEAEDARSGKHEVLPGEYAVFVTEIRERLTS